MSRLDWSQYPNFTEREFRCKHTGRCEMDARFMARLQRLRDEYGKAMQVNSGYRDPSHPDEAKKAAPGVHCLGRAVDIGVQGADAVRLVALAVKHGFTGIGVQQQGGSRFIHLDDLEDGAFPRPTLWSY